MGHLGLFTLAGLLALVAFAFGERAAVVLAQAILCGAVAFVLWLAYLVIGQRI
jgi:hypothetical protein